MKLRDTIYYSIEESYAYGWTPMLHYAGNAFPCGFAFTYAGAERAAKRRVKGFEKYLKKHDLWEVEDGDEAS